MRVLLSAALLVAACAAVPAAAQATGARIGASATVREAVSATAALTTIHVDPGGAIDLTMPLRVTGRAPVVVQAIEDGTAGERAAAVGTADGGPAPAETVEYRLELAPRARPAGTPDVRGVTYVISVIA